MNGNSVLLVRLYEKTSAKGNTYFAGRMGAASVVMMRDHKAEGSDPVWEVFVSEPQQRPAPPPPVTPTTNAPRLAASNDQTPPKRRQAKRTPSPLPPGDLNDDIGF